MEVVRTVQGTQEQITLHYIDAGSPDTQLPAEDFAVSASRFMYRLGLGFRVYRAVPSISL